MTPPTDIVSPITGFPFISIVVNKWDGVEKSFSLASRTALHVESCGGFASGEDSAYLAGAVGCADEVVANARRVRTNAAARIFRIAGFVCLVKSIRAPVQSASYAAGVSKTM